MDRIEIVIEEARNIFIGKFFESVSEVYNAFNLKDSDDLLMAWKNDEASKFDTNANMLHCIVFRDGNLYSISCYKVNDDIFTTLLDKDYFLTLLQPSLFQEEFIKNIKECLEDY